MSSRNYSPVELRTLIKQILFKQKKGFLLVLDNLDNLIKQNDLEFSEFLKSLTFSIEGLKILTSSSYKQVGLAGF